jgi:hypothetical protein
VFLPVTTKGFIGFAQKGILSTLWPAIDTQTPVLFVPEKSYFQDLTIWKQFGPTSLQSGTIKKIIQLPLGIEDQEAIRRRFGFASTVTLSKQPSTTGVDRVGVVAHFVQEAQCLRALMTFLLKTPAWLGSGTGRKM